MSKEKTTQEPNPQRPRPNSNPDTGQRGGQSNDGGTKGPGREGGQGDRKR